MAWAQSMTLLALKLKGGWRKALPDRVQLALFDSMMRPIMRHRTMPLAGDNAKELTLCFAKTGAFLCTAETICYR